MTTSDQKYCRLCGSRLHSSESRLTSDCSEDEHVQTAPTLPIPGLNVSPRNAAENGGIPTRPNTRSQSSLLVGTTNQPSPSRRHSKRRSTIHFLAWLLCGVLIAWALGSKFPGVPISAGAPPLVQPTPLPPLEPAEAEEIEAEGNDDQGKKVEFRIWLLTKGGVWRKGSIETFEDGSRIEAGKSPFSEALEKRLALGKDIICVGAASSEGSVTKEEVRAGSRADVIDECVRNALTKQLGPAENFPRVLSLNVGKFMCSDEELSRPNQRRAAIIAVMRSDEGADYQQALRRAMKKDQLRQPFFKSLLSCYSKFELL